MIVSVIVGADQVVHSGPLELMDSFDDRDGAGAVNASTSLQVAQASSGPGVDGHDHGEIYASTTPEGTYYSETWSANLAAGKSISVAAIMMAQNDCSSPSSCTGQKYPDFLLVLYKGSVLARVVGNFNNNMQYVRYVNSAGSSQAMTIKLLLGDWKSLSSTSWGVAWHVGQ